MSSIVLHPCQTPFHAPNVQRHDRPLSAPGLRLCKVCLTGISRSLIALPVLYVQCEEALVASTQGPGFAMRVSGSRKTGISLDERIVEARTAIKGILSSWARLGRRRARHPVTGS